MRFIKLSSMYYLFDPAGVIAAIVQCNTSLILSSEPIIEDVEIGKLKKKSLELAGI